MSTIAMDFGGTRIKLGLVDRGNVRATRIVDAESRAGLTARLPIIEQTIQAMCDEAGIDVRACRGVGMALPCLIRGDRIVSTIDKYPDATGIDLPDWGRRALGLPLMLENDANAALAGEWQFGAGRGHRSVVLMTLGTGVGTSAVVDGVPLRGQHGQAGCLGGHVTINIDGDRCVCGNIGCAESEASTWALPAQAKSDSDFPHSALAREPILDYRAVFKQADAGDALASRLRERAINVWSAAAVTLVHAYDPEVVILGGGIMKSPGPIVSRMQKYLDEHAWVGWGKVKVAAGELDDSAALLGLEYLVEQRIGAAVA